jgi:hypothetical protein
MPPFTVDKYPNGPLDPIILLIYFLFIINILRILIRGD